MSSWWRRLAGHSLAAPLLFVTLASYVTYVHDFSSPPQFFWDENYHVASAQKYLNGTFFMEPHPPLGKLMVAAGEALFQFNEADNQFTGTDYARDVPPGFSFAGYRLFPVLLGWLIAPLLFGCFYLLTRKPLAAMLLSSLYIFDNALLVHSRSAMLETTLLFGCVAMILVFLWLWQKPGKRRSFVIGSLLFGAAFGWVMTTKANGLIMILLIPPLLWRLRRPKDIGTFLALQTIAFAAVYAGVWQMHFALGHSINPALADNGYYQASDELKTVIAQENTAHPRYFALQLRDHLAFLSHYSKGVPRLDLCKSDENGSYPLLWPLGSETINYRWETPDGSIYRYLYLVPNPVVWFLGLASVLLAAGLLAAQVFLPLQKPLRQPLLLAVFLAMYLSYMIVMVRIDRVLYLYHYFIPLVFSFFLVALVTMEIRQVWRWEVTDKRRILGMLAGAVMIIAGFHYYRALTYNEPITDEAFARRTIFQIWDMHCVNCASDHPLVEKSC